jgi:hypothetical protein
VHPLGLLLVAEHGLGGFDEYPERLLALLLAQTRRDGVENRLGQRQRVIADERPGAHG